MVSVYNVMNQVCHISTWSVLLISSLLSYCIALFIVNSKTVEYVRNSVDYAKNIVFRVQKCTIKVEKKNIRVLFG